MKFLSQENFITTFKIKHLRQYTLVGLQIRCFIIRIKRYFVPFFDGPCTVQFCHRTPVFKAPIQFFFGLQHIICMYCCDEKMHTNFKLYLFIKVIYSYQHKH